MKAKWENLTAKEAIEILKNAEKIQLIVNINKRYKIYVDIDKNNIIDELNYEFSRFEYKPLNVEITKRASKEVYYIEFL